MIRIGTGVLHLVEVTKVVHLAALGVRLLGLEEPQIARHLPLRYNLERELAQLV